MSDEQAQLALPADAITAAWRIRFVESARNLNVIRRLEDPGSCVAVAEKMATLDPRPASADELHVLCVSSDYSLATFPANGHGVRVSTKTTTLFWQPGRAIVQSTAIASDELLVALAQFAFDEWHLRQLEHAVRRFEHAAPAHVPLAYLPNRRDRSRWPSMIDSAKELSLLRLRAARLEPAAYLPPRDCSPATQRVIARLIEKTQVEDRIEALSARLEACEDFYEGAVDRIVEQQSHRLELAIIFLLIIETLFIILELVLRAVSGH